MTKKMKKAQAICPLTRKEYNLLVKAGYQLEPYKELCIVKANDPFYREETEEMLRTAKEILKKRKKG